MLEGYILLFYRGTLNTPPIPHPKAKEGKDNTKNLLEAFSPTFLWLRCPVERQWRVPGFIAYFGAKKLTLHIKLPIVQ